MRKRYLTRNPAQTRELGENLAKEILRTKSAKKILRKSNFPAGQALVIGLEGDLGGGKTTFLQGFAKGLGIREKILSPTFIIFRRFEIKGLNFKNFCHIDCYRIKKPREILGLGFKEAFSNPQNIITVEWAKRIRQILPKNVIILKFQFIDKTTRKITIKISKKP
ncbi:MAG TPA: tRNA (adenosine(37)-N6)-threonylcarbamoyltransferase complex ATPase subunit type 1 TsaE [Candidatus Humimicrobiaceae bacterium]|nr:tRNA (adenosine(37)-N6)-threonylcarbamoyltransferase complex ATPase subunit type 1 TsaE [Candidatus Humimicrobiaceae bacterium]